jgi:hypothetical protein
MSLDIARTYRILGIFNSSGKELGIKIRIVCRDFQRYQENLDKEVEKWVRKYYGERLTIQDLDYDCEGEYESADNDDVIYMPPYWK